MSSTYLNVTSQDEEVDQIPMTEFNESLEDAELKSCLTKKIVFDDDTFEDFESLIKNGEMSKQIDKGMNKFKSQREEEIMLKKQKKVEEQDRKIADEEAKQRKLSCSSLSSL